MTMMPQAPGGPATKRSARMLAAQADAPSTDAAPAADDEEDFAAQLERRLHANDPTDKEQADYNVLQKFGSALDRKVNEQINLRKPVERRWIEDLRQYYGQYDPDVEAALLAEGSSRLFLNITRPKTNALAARFQDMLLPTDENNWALEHSPLPDVSGMLGSDEPVASPDGGVVATTPEGQPIQKQDVAKSAMSVAKEAAEAMEAEINDQLAECDYNASQRRVIEQMCQLGTGVMEGPVQVRRMRKRWVEKQVSDESGATNGETEWVQEDFESGVIPVAEWVDVWDFFPEMSCPEPTDWSFAFRRYYLTGKQVRERRKTMKFNDLAVRKLLAEEGHRNPLSDEHLSQLRTIQGLTGYKDDRYVVWKYVGPVDKEDLRSAGVNVDEDILLEYYATVWFSEGVVLKVDPYFLDSNRLPWSVAYLEKDTMSPFGWGAPRMMRGEQKGANSGWRMVFDNAGLSTGPQTVIDAGAIRGSDGNHRMRPRKTWLKDPAARNVPIENVFDQFTIDSHQDELVNIVNLAVRFADEVTSQPQLMQGEQASHITKTAQGMALLNNNSNVVLKRPVKCYDDYHTTPMIDRFVEWNMQFNKKKEIKGDFQSIAKGASVLLERDRQSQTLLGFMQYKGGPWDAYFDWEVVAEAVSKNLRVQDIALDHDKVQENLKAQADAAAAAAAAGQKSGPTGDPERNQIEREKLQLAKQVQSDNVSLKTLDYATKRNISLEQANKELAMQRSKQDHDARMFNAEAAVKQASPTHTGISDH